MTGYTLTVLGSAGFVRDFKAHAESFSDLRVQGDPEPIVIRWKGLGPSTFVCSTPYAGEWVQRHAQAMIKAWADLRKETAPQYVLQKIADASILGDVSQSNPSRGAAVLPSSPENASQ